ncbi:hypothetical protein EI94DRAFT_47713, partial [Lactarius quietus]
AAFRAAAYDIDRALFHLRKLPRQKPSLYTSSVPADAIDPASIPREAFVVYQGHQETLAHSWQMCASLAQHILRIHQHE